MDILPIQGSSVPCERVFSSGKETTMDRRNRISPELMEALQLLKFSLKQGHPLDFTTGTSWAEIDGGAALRAIAISALRSVISTDRREPFWNSGRPPEIASAGKGLPARHQECRK